MINSHRWARSRSLIEVMLLALALTALVSVMLLFASPRSASAQTSPTADYRFQDKLSTSVGTAPALTRLGSSSNAFTTAKVDGTSRKVLRFPEGNGVRLSHNGPTWGRYKKRTKPTLGNHEYYYKNFNMTTEANPYFDYFGARAGARGKGYYSYDRGGWHIVALNSNCGKVGGCDKRSPQGRWLRNDLANNPSRCTLAYFHRPLYSTGTNVAGTDVRPFWRMLHDRKADLIVNGHAHRYERFVPMTPSGRRSANGIRQIVAGTGGAGGGSEISYADAPNLQRVKTDVYGVLKLTLRDDSYSWKFVRAAGKRFKDSDTTSCH